MATKTVDEYLRALDGWQADTAQQVRALITAAAPEATESIKWAQPVYAQDGPLCYVKAFKKSVNFGFWRGVELADPKGLLQGDGGKMRHVKLTAKDKIDVAALTDFVKQAVQFNRENGDPTKR